MASFELLSGYASLALQSVGVDAPERDLLLHRIWNADDPLAELDRWASDRWFEVWPHRETVTHSVAAECTLMHAMIDFTRCAAMYGGEDRSLTPEERLLAARLRERLRMVAHEPPRPTPSAPGHSARSPGDLSPPVGR